MSDFLQKPIPAILDVTADTVYCKGDWTIDGISHLEKQVAALPPTLTTLLTFDGSQIRRMDTAGAWLLYRMVHMLEKLGQSVVLEGLVSHHQALYQMTVQYAQSDAYKPFPPLSKVPALESLGQDAYQRGQKIVDFLAFIGETTVIFIRACLAPRYIRWQAFFANLQTAGLQALPIVGLMSFLMGIVLAYQGGIQLTRYGANILVVDLTGITLLREFLPLLTAVLVAGRSGSAYTAQIGTMLVTEEVSALRTLGIEPMELLVLPKVLALMIALPLLTVFADIMGLLGSLLIANIALGVEPAAFLDRLPRAVSVIHYLIGIGKTPFFAAIIALVGCYQGFQVKGGADSVGHQVTISVVQAIFLVIIADAFFSILFSGLGF